MTRDVLSTTQKGKRGEAAAASYLESKGWSVLARNFRTRVLERSRSSAMSGINPIYQKRVETIR